MQSLKSKKKLNDKTAYDEYKTETPPTIGIPIFSQTKIGRKISHGTGSIIDLIVTSLKSGMTANQLIELCMPNYMKNHPDRVGKPEFRKWVAQRVKRQIDWAQKNLL